MPGIAYIGLIGISRLSNAVLIVSLNKEKGIFGRDDELELWLWEDFWVAHINFVTGFVGVVDYQ